MTYTFLVTRKDGPFIRRIIVMTEVDDRNVARAKIKQHWHDVLPLPHMQGDDFTVMRVDLHALPPNSIDAAVSFLDKEL